MNEMEEKKNLNLGEDKNLEKQKEFLWKTFYVFMGIVVVLAATIFVLDRMWTARAENALLNAEKAVAEDTYGGKTPEETLAMFISALKADNLALASKYFVIEEQEEKLARLNKFEEKKVLDMFVVDLEKNLKSDKPLFEESKRYLLLDSNGRETGVVNLIKSPNELWKISATF